MAKGEPNMPDDVKTIPEKEQAAQVTINKILNAREYMGDVVNFKTYSKSFKNKRRYENPEENHAIFEGVHEAIIDRQMWEMVQRIREGTKRERQR